mgnify:CR=1 FL=1
MKHKLNKKVLRRTLSLILVITMTVTGHEFGHDVGVYLCSNKKAEKNRR